ncbi:hypothetical protein BD560DRAFT_402328 [Blakeslea trispora]|nr:hypothetical protein BD560DRAFT_402328 [Blakeslea trispora]
MVNTTSNFFGFKQSSNYPAELLSIIIKTLKQNNSHMNTEENQQLGEGFKSVTRPWALVLVKEPSVFENTLKNRIVSIHTTGATTLDNMPPEERLWLDAIRVCCVENIHQLRAVVCSLHMKETNEKARHVVQWIQKEKDGQPPNLIVVVDLLDYLMNQQEKNYTKKKPILS